MTESIQHRGPDSTGFYTDAGIGLGVDRLSIIDLPTGDQPIRNEDGSIWVVYNGETYNFVELRRELESFGHKFYTKTDTEAVVHAYEQWGDESVSRLRGMFAFALWDSKRKRLYVARDRFGKKPLYYAKWGEVFLFGSELKTVLQYREIRREINPEALDHFFTYQYIPSPHTIFKGIYKLPPGHYAIYESGMLKTHQYWDLNFSPKSSLTEDEIVDGLYRTLEDAVRLRLRSDVPLGAFLSGGIDSSTVVALMSRLSETPVKTVSIGFDEGFSEVRYARQVAEQLGTDHREHFVSPDAFKILPRLVWHFDEPFADHSMIPTYYVSQITRREVKVALSGDGGDEMFMGYTFLKEPGIYRVYSKIPDGVRNFALRALLKSPVKTGLSRMARHAYEKGYGEQPPTERFIMRVTTDDRAGVERLYSEPFRAEHEIADTYSYLRSYLDRYSDMDFLTAIDYATIRGYLEEDILTKVDRMSMAVSLEVRCPLLDQEVASLVERIPSNLKLNRSTTKYIMKKMVVKKGLLPPSIANRKKQGFGAPVESWLKGSWKEFTGELLDPVVSRGYTGFFDREYVRKLLSEPYLNSNRLFSLATFVLWHKIYVDGQATRPTEAYLEALV